MDFLGNQETIKAQTDYALEITLKNPTHEQITDPFALSIILSGTNVIFEREQKIAGLQIVPGTINEIALESVRRDVQITRNKLLWFRLRMTMTNQLNQGSVISLTFPASIKIQNLFYLDIPVAFRVEKGINKVSADRNILIDFNTVTNVIQIKDFLAK